MAEKWDEVIELFNSALERSPAERDEFLRQACGQDDSLRSEIESLLASYDNAFLEDSPAGNISNFPSDAMIGRQIGAYRIIGECGHGGMAVVYLAERADQEFRKRVAIKMVKPGANNDEILRRFRNERQTLAALDHANIVKLLDGGSTDEGLPYLVMDYVEGVPIDQYCDSHRLSIPERLQLFRTVCSVVHYAHQNLVIHRDLKPSNILITKEGIPRLLDFGIAKLLNPECFQAPLVTLGDWRPMTPAYASPEQVRGEPVSNATDVYSLGVLLYELLSGHRPYRTDHRSFLEMERLVCVEEPIPPSTAVSTIAQGAEDGSKQASTTPELVSGARNTKPAELRRCLRGDLDTIVMMALRKEPQRRYASAEEFSNDIERYLSGMPVKARRPTVTYRGGKFLRRHGESVIAVVIVLTLMAALGAWEARRIWNQNIRSQGAGSVLVRARPSVAILGFKNLSTRADTEWLSTALGEMLTTELAAGEKLRTVPGETVARTKIDLGLPDTESLASDTLARVGKNLGSDFVVLGSYLVLGKDASAQIRLDLHLQDTAKGETIATASEVGSEAQLLELVSRAGTRLRSDLGIGEVSSDQSAGVKATVASTPDAMRFYSQGLEKLRAFDALAARDLLTRAVAADPSYPLAHSALAQAWLTLGYDANGQREAKKALDTASALSREDHLLVQARYYEANRQWSQAIETYRTLFSFFPDNLEYGLYLANAQTSGGKGKEALGTLAALANLGASANQDPRIDLATAEAASSLADNKLRRDAAEKAASKAGAQGARLLVARARNTQCRALANLGDNDKADRACEEAKRIYAEAGDRGGVARTLHNMGEVPLNQGDLRTAEKLYEEALLITRQIGDQHGIARELLNLGVVYKNQGDFARALEMYHKALQTYREIGDKRGMPAAIGNTANILAAQGRLSEARAQYEDALNLSRELGDKSSTALAVSNIGMVLAEQGDLAAASKMYQQSLDIHREIGQQHYYAADLVALGRIFKYRGDSDRALQNYLQALTLQTQRGEKIPASVTRLAIADLDCDSGKTAEAESLTRGALQEFQAEKDISHQIDAGVLLSRSLLLQSKLSEAQQAIAEARHLPPQARDVTVRMTLAIQNAYVYAAAKDFAKAEQAARQALTEAGRLAFVRLQFEASLALGEIQIEQSNGAAGRARLERLEKSARAKGFESIARKAAAAKT